MAPSLSQPDLVIPFGPRSVLAVVGIVTLIGGVWHVDRTWDERGSRAYERAAKEAGDREGVVVKIPPQELNAAFVFPAAFLVGWCIYGYANVCSRDGSMDVEVTDMGLISAAASVFLSLIASVPMGNAVRDRNATAKSRLGMAFVAGWVVLTYASTRANPNVHPIFCILGMVCIISSMKVLWKYRKMGDSWEQSGKPNPNPIVYNLGGPLFVFGWFLYWVGMAGNVAPEDWDGSGLPLYFNLRTLVAMTSGCGMVLVVMFVDYAHDEGGAYVGFPPGGTDGRFFGRFLESPIPFLLSWTMFGTAALIGGGSGDDDGGSGGAFFPSSSDIAPRQWIALANCILQGVDAGLLIQTALYEEDMARKNRWSIPFVFLFLALAANIGLGGPLPLALALSGAVLIVLGQKTVFGDRKRGDYFMMHHKNNPNPIVYSYGEPFFMAGWILLSLAMSLPM